ncbi:sensor histidine kinase [Streptomyces europaeiscabiei]|uniref:sensor histidine kinase n=2 Tax=Streptomyces europaeiscabiei TaxID=146819 RepID=UPI000628367C|nr:sensor histidine kinase [Streptomyces europaeiscabiei]MDX2526710.1 sensor domain-containing protein [Streptomyces europaeiscabiei]MDX3782263.1 sensor domain-containing protein [Streptomyces europaeiscabiei]MDX3831773.1 sensor domain-containing protein [Streptomyces europaeiscabiei]MDX3840125.1 sensor domain-containing protein [Streptomyces europaeiscabiei]MDX3863437.1 sensor domain-containing protein [Streptomyces europaeiscabiei]
MIRTVVRDVARAVAYLLSGVLVGGPLLVVLLVLGTLGLALAPVLVGLPLLAVTVLSGIPVGALERRRLALTGAPPLPDPHATPADPGLGAWARLRLTERATWRELAYTGLLGFVLWPLDAAVLLGALGLPGAMIGAPLHLATASGSGGDARIAKLWLIDSYGQALLCTAIGVVLLLALLWPLVQYARARAALARLLLAPSQAEAERRLGEVTRSRARLVAAFEAERRRIERDLHDGAQQRLVSLSMTLGLARLDAPPELADRLAAAHQEADQVLGELRELIHGIHPQVLADYGLPDALADAADRSAVPVELDVDLPRFADSVESAAYFAVREALANIGRHSGAERAWIGGRYEGGRLRVEVRDDGAGGADPARGTGLTGLADRLAVLDGRLSVNSPAGGPTVLSLEIPCPQR